MPNWNISEGLETEDETGRENECQGKIVSF